MSNSNENVTHTCSAAGWCETGCDWAQTDFDTTMIGNDISLADVTLQELYDYCSNVIHKLSERHEVVSEYAWDSDEDGSVVDDDSEEVRSVYAWDADEICSEYAWEALDASSDCDSEEDEDRCDCSKDSDAYTASEEDEVCSVYAWEEHEDLSDCDSVMDEDESDCSCNSNAKAALKLVDVYPDYESDSDDEIILYTRSEIIGNSPTSTTPKTAMLKDIASAFDMHTSSYCERGCCTTPECQQNLPSSNTDFPVVDWGDDDEEETSYVCERGCCAGPECQRYCAVPEYDALGLESPNYCENECCVGSECQRYPSSPVDNDDFLDDDDDCEEAPVDENQTEGESPFGFRMRFDKMKECRAVRSLHGHFSRIDYDNFEFSDLAGNKINVFFYDDDLHAVQQNQTTWFNFECLPPAVANTLCAARTAINSTFNY